MTCETVTVAGVGSNGGNGGQPDESPGLTERQAIIIGTVGLGAIAAIASRRRKGSVS